MKRVVVALGLAAMLASPSQAQRIVNSPVPVPAPSPEEIGACLDASAKAHGVPAPLLVILLNVEGGRLGRVTPNASGAPPDIGPIQVNARWVPRLAARWGTTPEAAFLALRDSFCANVEAGAWILRSCLDDVRGDFWRGVGCYNSRTPEIRDRYLRRVAQQAARLLRQASQQEVADVPAR